MSSKAAEHFQFNNSLNNSYGNNQTEEIKHMISKFSKESFTEYILIFWVFSLLIEEIRQV